IDLAGDVATKIDALLANPAAGIQQLNDALANALGLNVAVTTQTEGDDAPPTNEVQKVVVPNFVKKFALVFGDEFTPFIDRTAAATGVGSVEEALEAPDGIADVSVVKSVGT